MSDNHHRYYFGSTWKLLARCCQIAGVIPEKVFRLQRADNIFGTEMMTKVSECLRASIRYSLEHREDALEYAMQFARDMDTETADRFVAMWVNDLTLDYGDRGREAVKLLLQEGYEKGIIPNKVQVDFAE